MKRALKISAIALAGVLALLALLPFLLDIDRFRPDLERELGAALRREVKIGNLGLSLFARRVSVEDLAVADDPSFGDEPFVRAKALKVGIEILPLVFSRSLKVTDIVLEQPEIVLLLGDAGKWNFSTLGSSSGGEETAAPELEVAKLDVREGRVTVNRARSAAEPHVYDQVNISVRDFSWRTKFDFSLDAHLSGEGNVRLEGSAGPIDRSDTAATPVEADLKIERLDLSILRFAGAAAGTGGKGDFSGKLSSDGKQLRTDGTVTISSLQLAAKGAPAGAPVEVKYSVLHDLQKQSGKITQGDAATGKALAQLSGDYQMRGEKLLLHLKFKAERMPVGDLEPLLPALAVVLPTGSSLKGGTLSAGFDINGPIDKLVVSGGIRLVDTKVMGFDLGKEMSAISALAGVDTGPNTSIRNLSAEARIAPEGARAQKISLLIDGLGTVTGNGTVSPGGALSFKMRAFLASGGGGLQILHGRNGIPFSIQGTASDPSFVPDVAGIVETSVGGVLESTVGGILKLR